MADDDDPERDDLTGDDFDPSEFRDAQEAVLQQLRNAGFLD